MNAHECSACEDQKRALDPLESKFQATELPDAGAGNQICVLCRSLKAGSSLLPHILALLKERQSKSPQCLTDVLQDLEQSHTLPQATKQESHAWFIPTRHCQLTAQIS